MHQLGYLHLCNIVVFLLAIIVQYRTSPNSRKMELNIPDIISDTLQEIGKKAGKHAFLVGGSVRDLLLNRENLDIDIVVEGDAIQFAKEMHQLWKGSLQEHQQFGTATVTPENQNKPKVDFVTARRETYNKPGTLPNVILGSIRDDLQRRDFTINALAMRLDIPDFCSIIDETGGLQDLKSRTIRVLHKQSYQDDPTRIFRACRYAGRYGFSIDETDKTLIKEAIPIISLLSGERIRNEIDRVLIEDNAPEIVHLLSEFGVFEEISTEWKIPHNFSDDFKIAQKAISWASKFIQKEDFRSNIVSWIVLFGIQNIQELPEYKIQFLCFRLVLEHSLSRINRDTQVSKIKKLIDEFELTKAAKFSIELSKNTSVEYYNGKWCIFDADNKITMAYSDGNLYNIKSPITTFRQLRSELHTLNEIKKPSKIYSLLKTFPIETVVLSYFNQGLSKIQYTNIKEYLYNLRMVQPIISGKDLIRWGEEPGKDFKSILSILFSAQLDGEFDSKTDAITYFQQLKREFSNKNFHTDNE